MPHFVNTVFTVIIRLKGKDNYTRVFSLLLVLLVLGCPFFPVVALSQLSPGNHTTEPVQPIIVEMAELKSRGDRPFCEIEDIVKTRADTLRDSTINEREKPLEREGVFTVRNGILVVIGAVCIGVLTLFLGATEDSPF